MLTYPYSYSNIHAYSHSKTYSDATTSPKSAASPNAGAVMRLTEKVGCLGFAPVRG